MTTTPICVEQLKNAMATRLYQPQVSCTPALIGAPGTAKTAFINQLAKSLGYEVITIIASRLEPQDFNGFPGVGTKDGVEVSRYAIWDWQLEVLNKKKVVIFLDEFSNARPDTQASLLSFIQDREFPAFIDGKPVKLPDETFIICALNPDDSAADFTEISKPLANRIAWIPWHIPVSNWIEALESDFATDVVKRQVSDLDSIDATTVDKNYKFWKQRVIDFISRNQGMLHLENTSEVLASGEVYGVQMSDASVRMASECAWASGRSWTNLISMLACLPEKQQNNTSLIDRICQSVIGLKATAEFRRYLRKAMLFDPKEIIDNPESMSNEQYSKLTPEQGSDIGICISGLDPQEANLEQLSNVLKVLQLVAENNSQATLMAHMSKVLKYVRNAQKNVVSKDKTIDNKILKQKIVDTFVLYQSAAKQSLE